MVDGTGTPAAAPSPAPAGEEKEWADLAAEVGGDLPEGADGGEGGGAPAAEPDAGAEPKAAPVPYEELERRHRQTSGALKEAREQAKQYQDQLKAYNEMVAELRTSRQQQRAPDPAKEAPKEPDPYEDPIGYVNHHLAQLREEVNASKTVAQGVQQARQQEAEYKQFVSTVEAAETAFVARTPDYHEAAKFLEEGRRAELAVMFPDTPQSDHMAQQQGFKNAAHMRHAMFIQDAQTVAGNALRANMNPAEAYYNLAKSRGYKPGPAPDAAKQNEKIIDMARRGKAASRTIGGGSSGAPDNPLNVKDLTDLYAEDPEAFDREWDKLAKAGKLG